jgi:hypothetical protein
MMNLIHASVVLNSWMTVLELSVEEDFKDKLLTGWKRGNNKEKDGESRVATEAIVVD